MHRDFKGVWIPRDIWLIKGLSPAYRVFLAEIESLDNGLGCYAKNQHFASMFDLSRNRCSEIITMLFEQGYITIERGETPSESNGRILKVFKPVEMSTAPVEMSTAPVEMSTTIKGLLIHLEIPNIISGKEISFNDCIELLKNKKMCIESAARISGYSIKEVENFIPDFVKYCNSIDKKHNNKTDYFSHFQMWVNKQPEAETDISIELDWFLKNFNKISDKNYLPTRAIKNLFKSQIKEGYTGEQMLKAVKNLYDSRNTWHKKNNFIEATPEFILTGDRLNKFLNVKY